MGLCGCRWQIDEADESNNITYAALKAQPNLTSAVTDVVTATNQRGEPGSLPKAITVGAVINTDSHWVYLR